MPQSTSQLPTRSTGPVLRCRFQSGFHEAYELKGEIGRGAWAAVHTGTSKANGQK